MRNNQAVPTPQNTFSSTKRPACRPLAGRALAALAVWMAGQSARADTPAALPALRVTGAVSAPRAWDAAQARKELASQMQAIHYTLKGKAHTARAVPLLALINQAHPRFNPHIKNHALQFVIEVLGRDGYAADFSLAEIQPALGRRAVWLAWDEDGKPLSANEPAQIISPDDAAPARWVHDVAEVRILDTAQP